jgi:hypothetical protein
MRLPAGRQRRVQSRAQRPAAATYQIVIAADALARLFRRLEADAERADAQPSADHNRLQPA